MRARRIAFELLEDDDFGLAQASAPPDPPAGSGGGGGLSVNSMRGSAFFPSATASSSFRVPSLSGGTVGG